ncbi:MAG: sugar ABC transporter permease [Clostridia bacterium]|nr:sugar ABC transporter permease [Clostridia bacterium]
MSKTRTLRRLTSEEKKLKRYKLWQGIKRDKLLYIMLIPFVLYYILFFYMPMFGLQLAFKDYSPLRGIIGSQWVGMKHFVNFFTGPYAWRVIRNTFMINIYDLLINFTATIVVALMLNEVINKHIRSAIQTVIYMPHFVSTVVAAGMVVSLLSPSSGIINTILVKLGMEKIYFLAEPKYFRGIYTAMNGWQSIGFGTIIYTSAICAIDDSLYEAASIDGAGRLQKIIHITLPGIAMTITVMLIMKIGHMLSSSAESVLLLYQPITYETADVINTYVYREGLESANYSYSTAVGLFNGIVSFILVIGANKLSHKVNNAGLW